MQPALKAYDIGVIIGRFQVHELHAGHRSLLDRVQAAHRKVVVLLGMAPLVNTVNNPLDFEARRLMIQAEYPAAIVLYVKDVNDDEKWSGQVDRAIRDVLTPNQTALIYGSRDSFISHYQGSFHTFELDPEGTLSGTTLRQELGVAVPDSPEWRAGVIWASRNRFPTSYQAVDIALFRLVEDDDGVKHTELLLGRKEHEHGWRLPGGFADPGSESLEADAARELIEETRAKAKHLVYRTSKRIEDWRYRNEPDSIKTALFVGWIHPESPEPAADDDLAEVRWFRTPSLDMAEGSNVHLVMRLHLDLVRAALAWLSGELTYTNAQDSNRNLASRKDQP